MAEEYEILSALRVDLYECEALPAAIVRREHPERATRRAWIPQTLGDQIWVLYEFPTAEDRRAWEAGLSPKLRRWLDRGLIPHALAFGWGTRDANGFLQNDGRLEPPDPKEYPLPRERWARSFYGEGKLPCCGSRAYREGPRGGLSVNVTCAGCGARWNVVDPAHPALPPGALPGLARAADGPWIDRIG